MSQQPVQQPAPKSGGIGGGAILSLTGLGVLAIFILQNRQEVSVQFLAWSFTWPLWLYTVVVAVFGMIVWIGIGVMRRHRRRKERRQERRS